MDIEERLANDPYFKIREQITPTLVGARLLVLTGIMLTAGLLVWSSGDPLNPVRLGIAALFVLMFSMVTLINGIGTPHRRIQRQALALLQQAQYDEKTLRHTERMAQAGVKIPLFSYNAAILRAIAVYRGEARA